MPNIHLRFQSSAREGVAMCDNKSTNTRRFVRLINCEQCIAIVEYHVENDTEVSKFCGWPHQLRRLREVKGE